MKQRTSFKVIIAAALALTLIIFPGCKDRVGESNSKPKQIVALSFGGAFAEAQRAAYYTPFANETGIGVKEASYNGEYGTLKAAVQSRNVSWDVVDIESAALIRGLAENLFLPIDYSIVNTNDLLTEAVHEYAVGTDFYSVSLGFNTKAFPDGGPQPENWKDFWDTDRFPGVRTMKRDPKFTLEIALLADGVAPENIYANGKLDVDRAFQSLDRIKPHVKVWWATGAQPIQLLADGEVVMAAAFGARMWNAQHKDKQPVVLTWSQSIMDTEYWAVLRGAPNPGTAMEFINFASRADRQAEFPKHIPLGPVNRKAFEHMDSWMASQLNTYPDNMEKHILLNARWWAENETAVMERFNSWLQ